MTRQALEVFDGMARVGRLGYESLDETFSFEYDPRWLELAGSYSISPHILTYGQPAPSSTIRRFLDNLLPEGRALDVVATANRVSKNNLYGLIRELGQETSGALSFLPEGAGTTRNSAAKREIGRDELRQRIEERAQLPFMVWDGRVRMSIAGYQDKLAVYLDHDRMYLVEGELASTHILKPEPEGGLPMLVANEHFCMSLARRLGLAAAGVDILRLPDPVLVVERFDRVRDDERVRRLHIIDGCQALNFPASYKYERNFGSGRDVRHFRDGASFRLLFSLAAEYTVQKAVTRLGMMRWALFNYLIGNTDAHGKNISFFCRHDGLWLAPFYDLVSVVQYDGLDHELAMSYGDAFLLKEIAPYQWADFAAVTGTPRPLLAREMRRLGKAALAAAPAQAAEDIYVSAEKDLVQRIGTFVQDQAKKLLEMATPMTQIDPSLL